MSLGKAILTVGGLTGLSRIFGFIRDILTAAILGAGPIADAFFVALKLPNFFRRVTAEGAFSIAFVPLYTEKLTKQNHDAADAMASNAFMVMSTVLSLFTVIAIAAMPFIIDAIAPGFARGETRFDLAIELSRITFPYLLCMSLVALLGGVLNAHNKFAPFAVAPVIFNVCLIGALLTANLFQTAGHAMAYAILAAGVLQLIFLVIAAKRSGFRFKIATPRFDVDIKKILKLMGPATIGAGVVHINLFADLIIASFLPTGSISHLYYADRLNQLPLGVVGIAVGTALLPMLSKAMSAGDTDGSRHLFNRALEMSLLYALPAAVALAVIPTPLITMLFERGAFTAADTAVTANVLRAYAIGLPAYVAIKVFSTAHWARQDTITPVKISVIATITNIILSLILIRYIGAAGIALGTGITGWMQFAMHMRALKSHPAATFEKSFIRNVSKIMLCAIVMGGVLYAGTIVLDTAHFVTPVILVLLGLAVYGVGVLMTGVLKVSDIKMLLRRNS